MKPEHKTVIVIDSENIAESAKGCASEAAIWIACLILGYVILRMRADGDPYGLN